MPDFAPPNPSAPTYSTSGSGSTPQSPQEKRPPEKKPPEKKPPQPASLGHGLSVRSCVICRRRKVKCDKKVPCTNCSKNQVECIYPAPGRAPRRPREGGKPVSEREAQLIKRLHRLESVVQELSGQIEIDTIKHSPGGSDNSHRDSDPNSESHKKSVRVIGMDQGSKGTWINRSFNLGEGPPKTTFTLEGAMDTLVLDEGKSQYVANPFWASITEEVKDIREILEDNDIRSDNEDLPPLPTTNLTEPGHQNFIMGYSSSDVNLHDLHPLPSQIPFYWQTFLENVNPLTKIVHRPTMEKVIKEVQHNLDSLSPSTEALMFAIYFSTITSLNADEVRTNFGVAKDTLIKQYRFGTEQALARAGFLNTNEIVTVQAFVLFLVCVRRHDDTRFVWSLTGLAIRLAQSLGLHRDGSKFGLSPFDTEMRRRLWWNVCILDIRASDDHGSDPAIIDQLFDTEFPLSLNDSDLDPGATDMPVPKSGVSEMTFCLIRYEICTLSRKLSFVPPRTGICDKMVSPWTIEDKERAVKETADRLERIYLQYCTDAGPLYWVAATVARLVIAKMKLIIYHPYIQPGKSNGLSQDVRDSLFMSSIETIEYSRALESESSTKQWGWLFHTYTQWHAIAFILGELSTRDNSIVVDRAWSAIDGLFANWEGAVSKTKTGMLWQPMRRLMAKARHKREENMANSQNNLDIGMDMKHLRPPPTGPFVNPAIAQKKDSFIAQLNSAVMPSAADRFANSFTIAESAYNSSYNRLPLSQNTSRVEQPTQSQTHSQVQSQEQQQETIQQTPWLMDDSALLDLDMQGIEGEVNWDSWDALVRDFQFEPTAPNGDGRGQQMAGAGDWW
ncbi:fungal-specific transcription factor domain-containing protein [Bisporella sp. PMI_857]|nr:fungal-specific transcription factor domain-containing protein [Bisporella sp. PMI_857]